MALEVQMRDNNGGLFFRDTIAECMEHAQENPSIWKISWTDATTHERIRLVKMESVQMGTSNKVTYWVYEPIEMLPSVETSSERG